MTIEAKLLNTVAAIKTAFSDPAKFKVLYAKDGYGSALLFDDPTQSVVFFSRRVGFELRITELINILGTIGTVR